MRQPLSQQFVLIVVFLWAQGWSFAQEPTTPPASSPGDIATYYPQQDNIVRWYAVEDMKTGQKLDNMRANPLAIISVPAHKL